MPKYISNANGDYPSWSANNDAELNLEARLGTIFYMLNHDQNLTRIKLLINDVDGYLERNEGFHYGVSEGFENADIEMKRNSVTEHTIPANVLVTELINQVQVELITSTEELLVFLKENYYICLVTAEENGRLGRRLRNNMPDGWQWGNDWLARYGIAEITLVVPPTNQTLNNG